MASIYRLKNSKNWYYSITFHGKRYQESTKTTDKQSAKQIAESIQTDIAREKHDLPVLKNNKSIVNFTILWQEYIKNSTNAKNTLTSTVSRAKHFLPVFQNKLVEEIMTPDIKNYQLKRRLEIINNPKNRDKRESEISFKSLNHELQILHNFFNFCIEKNHIEKNPAAGIRKLNTLSRIKTLSDEDIQKLISGATNKLTRDLITFLIYTGCRKGEALNLKWDDVDLKTGIIAIKGTKTKYDRYIPISEPLKAILRSIEKGRTAYMSFKETGLN